MTLIEPWFPGLAGMQNIHPLFVHFPVALLAAALGLQILASLRRRPTWAGHARALLYVGTLGAIVALATGFLAADQLGHESPGHDLVHVHRNFMIVTTLLAVATSAAAFGLRNRSDTRDRLVLVGLLATSVALAAGADRGANLVFRYGMGVRLEPVPESEHSHHHDEGAMEPAAHDAVAPGSAGEMEPHTHAPDAQPDSIPDAPLGAGAAPVHDHAAHDHGMHGDAGLTAPVSDAAELVHDHAVHDEAPAGAETEILPGPVNDAEAGATLEVVPQADPAMPAPLVHDHSAHDHSAHDHATNALE